MDLLRLVALDGDDMDVVSAHVQDAVLCASDVHWRRNESRVVIALNRFDWEAVQGGGPQFRRHRSALRFDRVLACQCKNFGPEVRERILNLLSVSFTETENDAPGGWVTLTFSGGAVLRLQVECIEAELADLGPSWAASCCPQHEAEALPNEPAVVSAPARQG